MRTLQDITDFPLFVTVQKCLNLNSSKLLITLLIKSQEQEKVLLKVAEKDFVSSLKWSITEIKHQPS